MFLDLPLNGILERDGAGLQTSGIALRIEPGGNGVMVIHEFGGNFAGVDVEFLQRPVTNSDLDGKGMLQPASRSLQFVGVDSENHASIAGPHAPARLSVLICAESAAGRSFAPAQTFRLLLG